MTRTIQATIRVVTALLGGTACFLAISAPAEAQGYYYRPNLENYYYQPPAYSYVPGAYYYAPAYPYSSYPYSYSPWGTNYGPWGVGDFRPGSWPQGSG